MAMKNKLVYVSVIFTLLFIIIYFVSQAKSKKYVKDITSEYPLVDLNTKLNGVITDILQINPTLSRNNPFQSKVTIDDTIKITISTGYELNSHLILDEVLTKGLFVTKDSGNKYLFFYRYTIGDTLKYEFIIHDSKGYEVI
jgi:hypothetical protein